MTEFRFPVPDELLRLAACFSPEKPLWLVGGYVRDRLMERRDGGCDDLDVCSAVRPEELAALLEKGGFSVAPSSPRLGTMLIKGERGYEYTCFRTDSYPRGSGAHAPERVVFTDDLEVDARRRDFRCNALYYDVARGILRDPTGGLDDIRARRLACPRPARETFSEDGLRLLRLIRFIAELGFEPSQDTAAAAATLAARLKDISAERVGSEWLKITAGAYFEEAAAWASRLGVPKLLFGKDADLRPAAKTDDRLSGALYGLTRDERFDCARAICLRTATRAELRGLLRAAERRAEELLTPLRLSEKLLRTAALRTGLCHLLRRPPSEETAALLCAYEREDARAAGKILAVFGDKNDVAERALRRAARAPEGIAALALDGRDVAALGFANARIGRALAAAFNACALGIAENTASSLTRCLNTLGEEI